MTGPEHYREAERLVERAHHYTYGDGADPVTGAALAAEAQVHATLALTATQMVPAPLEAEPAVAHVYRAEHPDSGIILGHYGTEAAARAHCEDMERRSWPTGASLAFDWIEDEDEGVAELVVVAGQNEVSTTGYLVTVLELASEYDPEADA